MSAHYYDEGPPAEGRKVLLAVPTYDAPDACHTFALARSREALTEAGIQSALLILQGNCHVDDARNSIVRDFLESDCTELVFLDADVTWEPKDLVQLCQRDCDIVGGVYPYRREGGMNMPVRLMGNGEVKDGLREVEGLPTGFMKIKRHVLEKMASVRPWYFDKIYPTAMVFDRPDPGEDHTRWGGDIDFCNRWRAMGGKLYADEELRLGHAAKIIVYDSLAAHLRRLSGLTLGRLIPRFREGVETENDFSELYRYADHTADVGTLVLACGLARKCAGPIISAGSGMSAVLMAAVTGQKVYALEHLEHVASRAMAWAREAGVDNLGICYAPLTDECWYDVDKFDLAGKFSVGFIDGPSLFGTRMKFFDVFADRCTVVLVENIKSDNNFAIQVHAWAEANGRKVSILGRSALIQKADAMALAA